MKLRPPTLTSRACRHRRRNPLGFTLTELLVVVGIIVLLAALGLPMAMRAYRTGNKTRTQADLQSIATALNAYKQDFGDYPRVTDWRNAAGNLVPGTNTGAAVLGKALIGPYGDGVEPRDPSNPGPAVTDTLDPPAFGSLTEIKSGQCVSNAPGYVALVDDPGGAPPIADKWAPFVATDGADGPGFRTRIGPDGFPQGRVWGPYLQAQNFNVVGIMLHDRDGKPILYFPAKAGRANIRAQVQSPTGPVRGFVDRSEFSLYDANDNLAYFKRAGEADADGMKALRAMLGDMDDDGIIDQGESPATEDAFILWSAGPDGQFGPIRSGTPWNPTRRDIDRCDDVTSFTP